MISNFVLDNQQPHTRVARLLGGGISLDRSRWIAKRPDFFPPVRVLSKLFRRLVIEKLVAAHAAGQLAFYGAHAALVDATAFSGLRNRNPSCDQLDLCLRRGL